jgi:CheY-like chemotaxis protein
MGYNPPLRAGSARTQEAPMAIPKSALSRRPSARILIADENSATLEFFSRLFEDRGFTTSTADSGEAVLKFLLGNALFDERDCEINSSDVMMRSHRSSSGVILIGDLMEPPIDGLDLIRRLRAYRIPIVVATSYGSDYALLAKMAGAKVIVHKFADPTYLITTIEEALKQSLLPLIPKAPPR